MPPAPSRREGFAGQHLVIVPAPIRDAMERHALLSGLLVTDAGYFPCAKGHRVERPQGAATHLLILCTQGRGWIQSGDRQAEVAACDLVWLHANTPHAYGAASGDPWTILWTHFQGSEVEHWQQELGWAEKPPFSVVHFGRERAGTLGLEKVYACLESGYSIQDLLAAGAALRAVFCAALHRMSGTRAAKTSDERTAAVREAIVADPARAYSLGELAASAGLSVPHFCLLFRRQTGFAPIDFVNRQRIRAACRLLDTTKESVRSIASEVGFDDPYYFSRCFHRIMGLSPRTYRAHVKG